MHACLCAGLLSGAVLKRARGVCEVSMYTFASEKGKTSLHAFEGDGGGTRRRQGQQPAVVGRQEELRSGRAGSQFTSARVNLSSPDQDTHAAPPGYARRKREVEWRHKGRISERHRIELARRAGHTTGGRGPTVQLDPTLRHHASWRRRQGTARGETP